MLPSSFYDASIIVMCSASRKSSSLPVWVFLKSLQPQWLLFQVAGHIIDPLYAPDSLDFTKVFGLATSVLRWIQEKDHWFLIYLTFSYYKGGNDDFQVFFMSELKPEAYIQ